jgi:hypothetical protein
MNTKAERMQSREGKASVKPREMLQWLTENRYPRDAFNEVVSELGDLFRVYSLPK